MSKNNQTIKEIREDISRGNTVNLTQTQDNDLLIEILMDPTIRTKKEVNRLRNELIKYSCEKLD